MLKRNSCSLRSVSLGLAALLLLAMTVGCSRETKPTVKKIPAGKEFSGFLKDYSNLKPNDQIGGNALTYARTDAQKNLHKYVAIIVDPVEVYLASDADEGKISEKARTALSKYFEAALAHAVSDAFPLATEKGPLVLRLRAAIIGVDVGGALPAEKPADGSEPLTHAVNIGKVGVEMELVDSETGEQIAALVDRENLGAGAEVGSLTFSREEKYRASREAFKEWAARVRTFMDAAHELSKEDAERAAKSYMPYGAEADTAKK